MSGGDRSRAWRSWLAFGLWVAAIYLTVPFVRTLERAVKSTLGVAAFGYLVVVTVAIAFLGCLWLLLKRARRLRLSALLGLLAVTAAFVIWALHLWLRPGGEPVEAVHLVEYGLLGVLAARALRHHASDSGALLAAALLVALVGTLDEVIQWVVPNRYFDLRDIVVNAGSGALVQVALGAMAEPPGALPRPAGLRLACHLGVAELLLLGLCLLNTPARVEAYRAALPGLAFLSDRSDTMAEYGYRLVDPVVGTFRSRLRLAELEQQDRSRGVEVAAIVGRYPRYRDFLAEWGPARDPFAYEARVHLFSRDQNLADSRKNSEVERLSRQHATTAYRENLLLETFFLHTLAASRQRLSAEVRAELEALQQPGSAFESRVSSHLITAVSERQALVLVAGLTVALLALGRRLGRKNDGRKP